MEGAATCCFRDDERSGVDEAQEVANQRYVGLQQQFKKQKVDAQGGGGASAGEAVCWARAAALRNTKTCVTEVGGGL